MQNSGSTQLEQPLLLATVEISKKSRDLFGWGCTFDAPKGKLFKHLWIGLKNESLKGELLYLVGLSPCLCIYFCRDTCMCEEIHRKCHHVPLRVSQNPGPPKIIQNLVVSSYEKKHGQPVSEDFLARCYFRISPLSSNSHHQDGNLFLSRGSQT